MTSTDRDLSSSFSRPTRPSGAIGGTGWANDLAGPGVLKANGSTPRPFRPRPVEPPMARLASLLGAGRRGRLRAGSDTLTLTTVGVSQGALAALDDGLRMETPAGVLVASPAQALLRVLTHIDVPESGPLHRLLLDLALQGVPGGWLDLFGAPGLCMAHGNETRGEAASMLALSLVLSDGRLRLPVTLHGAASTLLAVLSRPGWWAVQPTHSLLPIDWSPRVPLRLGESLVGAQALRCLAAGDVLLIEQPTFDLQGHGRLSLGRRVALCELSLGNRVQCRFTNWADGLPPATSTPDVGEAHSHLSTPSSMNAMDADTDALRMDRSLADAHVDSAGRTPAAGAYGPAGGSHAAGGAAHVAAASAHTPGDAATGAGDDVLASPLDDLPVRLTFDLGTLELSLGDLQTLTPGTILPLSAGVPPLVQVRCEGRLVAAGELVEVDGRLGVELTRLGALA